jgi:hypothetical protein
MPNNDELLATIVIPNFITRILISKRRRPTYYKKDDKIPKKYSKNKFQGNYLVDEYGKRIVKNTRSVGKEKYQQLSGNNLLSGYGSHHMRAKVAKELKEFYKPFVKNFVKHNGAITKFPLRVEWDVYTDISATNWDASNLFFYYKYFEDTLFMKDVQLIPDDNIKFITWSPGPKIIPIDDWNKRKFVFRFYYDNRDELRREPWISSTPSDIK